MKKEISKVRIECDNCDVYKTINRADDSLWDIKMREEGWIISENIDLCPSCAIKDLDKLRENMEIEEVTNKV